MMEELEIYEWVNVWAFVVGIVFGAISQKSQFCFNGSIKDYINTKSKKRAASVVVAMITSIVATTIIAGHYDIDLSSTVYLKENMNYFAVIVGGVLFGLGMVISDGCTARHMVKFSSGDTYSLIPLLFIAISAFATIKGVLNPLLIPFMRNETLLGISSSLPNFTLNIYFVLIVLCIILIVLIKDDLKTIYSVYDGVIIGVLVATMWYVTGFIGADSFERTISLGSLSFIYSSGETLQTLTDYTAFNLKYSVILIFGIFVGAFIVKLLQKKEASSCSVNGSSAKLRSKIIGGILMGVGGVFALGCTVGQGLTGISTLAFSSFLAIGSILLSAYFALVFQKRSDKNQ